MIEKKRNPKINKMNKFDEINSKRKESNAGFALDAMENTFGKIK